MSAKRRGTNAELEREIADLRAGAYRFLDTRVIGRFGSRSGMRWNELHDAKTCTCGLGKALRG